MNASRVFSLPQRSSSADSVSFDLIKHHVASGIRFPTLGTPPKYILFFFSPETIIQQVIPYFTPVHIPTSYFCFAAKGFRYFQFIMVLFYFFKFFLRFFCDLGSANASFWLSVAFHSFSISCRFSSGDELLFPRGGALPGRSGFRAFKRTLPAADPSPRL